MEANTHTHTQHTGHDANVLSDMGYPSAKHHGSSKQGERLPEGGLGRGFKVRWHGTACAYSRQSLGKGKGPAEWASWVRIYCAGEKTLPREAFWGHRELPQLTLQQTQMHSTFSVGLWNE